MSERLRNPGRLTIALLLSTLCGCTLGPQDGGFALRLTEPRPASSRIIYDPISGASYRLAGSDLQALRMRAASPPASAMSAEDAPLVAPVRVAVASANPPPAAPVAPAFVPAGSAAALVKAPPVVSPAPPGALVEAAVKLQLDREFASISRMVPFALNRAELGPWGRKAVAELLPIAREARQIQVRGRTDASGSAQLNESLARARARSVAAAFVEAGIAQGKIAISHCLDCFVAANSSLAGRRKNRRVDVEFELPRSRIAQLPPPRHALETPQLIIARTLGARAESRR